MKTKGDVMRKGISISSFVLQLESQRRNRMSLHGVPLYLPLLTAFIAVSIDFSIAITTAGPVTVQLATVLLMRRCFLFRCTLTGCVRVRRVSEETSS